MKNDQKIYELKKVIKENKKYLNLKITALESQEKELMNVCDHSLVFNLTDTNPHKIGLSSIHFCPACLKQVNIYNNQIEENYPFNDSHLINIGKCNFKKYHDIIQNIQNIIFTYPDFYYNFNINDQEKVMEINALLEEEIIKPKIKMQKK